MDATTADAAPRDSAAEAAALERAGSDGPGPSLLRRGAYAAVQAMHVAWYAGHFALAQRSLSAIGQPDWPVGPVPDRGELLRAVVALFRQDLRNMEAGRYRAPSIDLRPDRALRRSIRFLRDLPEVDRRRRERQVVAEPPDSDLDGLPPYFRQAFHFQTGGYLTAESAELYDMQVEVLFTGAAAAMRRQALPPVTEAVRNRPPGAVRLLDVACGTGRFTAALKDNFPAARVTGLDMSAAYLDHARRRVGPRPRLFWQQGAAEALPFPDGHFDAVSAVFLFHELPRKIRRRAAAEMVRVTRPGGRIVLLDSLQKGDRPEWDGLLDLFPHGFHEPYFRDYVDSDIAGYFTCHDCRSVQVELAFLSKLFVFSRNS